jgi:hypothetical protein
MATIIQASLDQSLKVDGWRGRRHAEYYNKRPAGEKNRRIGNEGKRQPFVSGRFEGGEVVDWTQQSTDEGGARCDGKAGGYLQRLNVWRQRLAGCTTAGPRMIGRVGRRGSGMALRTRRGASGPEIDAREKSIIDLRTTGIQTGSLQRKELGKEESDEVLIPAVSMQAEEPHQRNMAVCEGRTCVCLAPPCAGERQSVGTRTRREHGDCPALGWGSAQTAGARMPGRRRSSRSN